ncbi:hypothetical protein D3C85_1679150 [compost metagenome]
MPPPFAAFSVSRRAYSSLLLNPTLKPASARAKGSIPETDTRMLWPSSEGCTAYCTLLCRFGPCTLTLASVRAALCSQPSFGSRSCASVATMVASQVGRAPF